MKIVSQFIRLRRWSLVAMLAFVGGMLSGISANAATDTTQMPSNMLPAKIARNGSKVRVDASKYAWAWSADDDKFTLYDSVRRKIVSGPLQPVVIVRAGRAAPACVAGKVADVEWLQVNLDDN